MILPVDDITGLIPQKHPFVMVSRLLIVEDNLTRSSFIINADNVFVKNDLFQEAGLMENIAQTAALRAGYMASINGTKVTEGYIVEVKDFEVLGLPKVNDELTTEVTIENQIFNVTVLTGKVWHKNNLLATCEMKVFEGN